MYDDLRRFRGSLEIEARGVEAAPRQIFPLRLNMTVEKG
jgi:hypothetical protein